MWSDGFFEDMEAAIAPHVFARAALALVLWAVLALMVCAPAHAQIPSQAHAYRREYVRIVRSEWGLNAPVASLAAQIEQESGWDCGAASRDGGRGCAQFMPATANWIGGLDKRLAGGDLFSPAWAFRAQAYYMRWLFDRVHGSPRCERMAFALSAYNGGLGWVRRRQQLSSAPERCFGATCGINPGIDAAMQAVNERYPRRILFELEPHYVEALWGLGSCSPTTEAR